MAARLEKPPCGAHVITRVGQQHHLGQHGVDFVHGVVRYRAHLVAAATQLVGGVGTHQAGAGDDDHGCLLGRSNVTPATLLGRHATLALHAQRSGNGPRDTQRQESPTDELHRTRSLTVARNDPPRRLVDILLVKMLVIALVG